jgi:hypothetical protein
MKAWKGFLLALPLTSIMSCTSLRKVYDKEVRTDIQNHPPVEMHVYEEKDIATLPPPVRRYFRYCGYIGKHRITNAQVIWKDAALRMSPGGKWRRISCLQYNAVTEPVRVVYMKHRIIGMFPFEGRDKYQHGHGNMWIRLLKVFTVTNAKGKEMDESALVTLLAETFLVPGYILQPYIKWTAIDEHSAKATISYNGATVSGIFHFNDKGEMTSFDTEDRNYEHKGTYSKIRWTAYVSGYTESHGIRFAQNLSAAWHMKTGDYEYYRGQISDVIFNIRRW